MAVQTEWVTVGTTAAKLTGTTLRFPGDVIRILVRAPSGSDMFIGGADVTALNGFKISAGLMQQIPDLVFGEDLYAILATGTGVSTVMRTGVK